MSTPNDVVYSIKGFLPGAATLVTLDRMHLY